MTQYRSTIHAVVGLFSLLASLSACSDDDDKSNPQQEANSPSSSPPGHPLVIMTERQGPDMAFHYLHVLADWPANGELDYGRALELGTPGVARIEAGAIYFYHAQEGAIERLTVEQDLRITRGNKVYFTAHGISGFDPEPIWVSPQLAFMLDERSAQIARWNPTTMLIESVARVSPDVLVRDGLKVQFQLGIAAGARLFTSVNWRNWDTNKVAPGATLGLFDQNNPGGGPQLLNDQRCTASVSVGPFRDAEGYVYLVADGAQGYDMVANPNRSPAPQCVVRLREDASQFDPNFFVDLQAVTKSPAIYAAFPMPDHKLLVSMWSPEVDVATVADPTRPGWYWEAPPYFEYAIVDLNARTSTKVAGLPRAAIQGQKMLIVDGQNYVQLFRADRGSTLHRVAVDGTVTQVLNNPAAANVQFLGRL